MQLKTWEHVTWYQSSSRAQFTSWEFRRAPKKDRKQAQETMLEKPIKDWVVLPESIGEEEPRTREDQDEPENEEE
jgi:hypothetical protein